MSLIKCPECGKEVSDKATQCSECGYPIQKFFEADKYAKIDKRIKNCKHCGREITKSIGKCPYCGKNQNPVLEAIGAIILILIIISLFR